jgi:hypothetical protein
VNTRLFAAARRGAAGGEELPVVVLNKNGIILKC